MNLFLEIDSDGSGTVDFDGERNKCLIYDSRKCENVEI